MAFNIMGNNELLKYHVKQIEKYDMLETPENYTNMFPDT